MKLNTINLLLPFILVFSTSCQGQGSQVKDQIYQHRQPSIGGTGKIYLGREISTVMGHQGANWLERNERLEEERTDLVLENLPVDTDATVADIGAGSGYYTERIAGIVPAGKVYAVDIQPEMLSIIKAKTLKLGLDNVALVQNTAKSTSLPENSVDLAIMVDVYHELEFPYEMMKDLYGVLKEDGKVLLLEYKGEDPDVPIKKLHKMTEKQVIAEMEFAGYKFVSNQDFLPWQHFLLFEK